MASTASSVAIAMEVIAALGASKYHKMTKFISICCADLFYNDPLNPAIAIFQIFASQMLGYGMAGIRTSCLVFMMLVVII
jgi:hypothetical protein